MPAAFGRDAMRLIYVLTRASLLQDKLDNIDITGYLIQIYPDI